MLQFNYRAATVHIPKPPPETTAKAIQKRRELRKKREAEVSRVIFHSMKMDVGG